jgi:flagellar FliL protein
MTQPDKESDDSDKTAAPAKKKSGVSKLLVIVGAVIVLTCAGLAGAYFTGMLDPLMATIAGTETPEPEEHAAASGQPTFYEMPDFVISLNNGDRKSRFMKVRVSLELEDKSNIPEVERLMPRIVDNVQVYLRELRADDLKGSAGTHRLREELLRRINASVAPLRIGDVLFLELLLQ